MSDFNSLLQYTVENISRPVKYIIYKLTEFIRVVGKFVYRQVPAGAASGYANIEKVEGNTLVWNQQVNDTSLSFYRNYGLTMSLNSHVLTVNGLSSGGNSVIGYYDAKVNLITNHKYLIRGFNGQVGSSSTFEYMLVVNIGSSPILNLYLDRVFTYENVTKNNIKGQIVIRNGYTADNLQLSPQIFDLTAIFGAGNEPTTVADFEAWMAQNIGSASYYDYNAGELISCKMSGMQTEDSSQQTLDTLPFDVTTFTGINTSTNVREVIFPNGMKQADYAGTVKDTFDLLSDTATVKVGSRAYQAGDESDTDVITDGTTTYYALTTPIEYTDLQDANGNPLNPRYKVEQGGTEQILPVNTSSPTTVAPTLTTTYTKDNN